MVVLRALSAALALAPLAAAAQPALGSQTQLTQHLRRGAGAHPRASSPAPAQVSRQEHEAAFLEILNPSSEDYGRRSNPKNPWSPVIWQEERKAYHKTLVKAAVAEMMEVAELMKDEVPGIYCLRGNTAAGKSSAVKMGLIPTLNALLNPSVKDKEFKALNPDPFKKPLMEKGKEDGKSYSHMDVHTESSNLCEQVYQEMLTKTVTNSKGEAVPASFVVDQRLAWEPQIDDDIIPNAKKTGRKVFVYDIDCPLRMSLMGVLKRPQGGEDPIPPFGAVSYGGYVPIVANRDQIMKIFKGEVLREFTDTLGEYVLYATKADFSKVKVMSIENKVEKVVPAERKRYEKMEEKTDAGDEALQVEVRGKGDATIDSAQIKHVCGGMSTTFASTCGRTLCPWIGVTWQQATDSWAGLSSATASPDEEKCKDKSKYDERTLFA